MRTITDAAGHPYVSAIDIEAAILDAIDVIPMGNRSGAHLAFRELRIDLARIVQASGRRLLTGGDDQ